MHIEDCVFCMFLTKYCATPPIRRRQLVATTYLMSHRQMMAKKCRQNHNACYTSPTAPNKCLRNAPALAHMRTHTPTRRHTMSIRIRPQDSLFSLSNGREKNQQPGVVWCGKMDKNTFKNLFKNPFVIFKPDFFRF
jgi:hypothetical protein